MGKEKSRPLTRKQEAFAEEYIKDLNSTAAAIRAGYSKHTATQAGYSALQKERVVQRIRELQAERARKRKWDSQKVLDRLIEVADLDVQQIMEDDITLKPLSEWPKAWRRALSGLEIVEIKESGDPVGYLRKIKWPDRLRALELLGKHIDIRAFDADHNDADQPPPTNIVFNIAEPIGPVKVTRGKG